MSNPEPGGLEQLPIAQLDAHPSNSNVMPEALMAKLGEEIARTGHYPPVIVRPHGERYQIIDGHHRVEVLRRLGHATVQAVTWAVDDEQALLLLATLNRLSGDDDPRRRAALVAELRQSMDIGDLARRLPEDIARVRKLLELNSAPPSPRTPTPIQQMPVCLNFFVLPEHRRRVEQRLRDHGGTREQALLSLLCIDPGDVDD